MRKSTSNNTKESDLLFLISGVACVMYIVMRVLTAGAGGFNPQNVFLNGIALFALFTAVVSRLLSNGLILPQKKVIIALIAGVFVALVLLAKTAVTGYYYPASVMVENWFADLLVMLAVMITARERNYFRLYAAVTGAMIAVTGVYTLYQKLYALDYLRDIAQNSLAFKDMIRSRGLVVAQAFIERIEDGWVGGGFGSQGALCAFGLLTICLVYGIGKNRKTISFEPALLFGLVCIVFSESVFGVLVAKVLEIVMLFRIIRGRDGVIKNLLLALGGVGVLTLISLVLMLGAGLMLGEFWGLAALSVLWYFEVILLSIRYNNSANVSGEHLVGYGILVMLLLIVGGVVFAPVSSDLGYIREYWLAEVSNSFVASKVAFEAFLQAPLLGWGLDNFQEVHALFKDSYSRGVGRAANIYLELLADGGVILTLVGLISFIIVFFSGTTERRLHLEVESGNEKIHRLTPSLIVLGFIITYLLVFAGLFDHMGVEYFLSELYSTPTSAMSRGISTAPMMIHFTVNFILLPVVALYAFNRMWRYGNGIDYNDIDGFIRLSVVGLAIYSITVDTLYMPALSGMLGVMGGLLLSRQRAWGMLNIRRRVRMILLYLIMIMVLLWGVWGVWDSFVLSVAQRVALSSNGNSEDEEMIQNKILSIEKALELSDNNADLYLSRANMLIRLYEMDALEVDKKSINEFNEGLARAAVLRPFSGKIKIAQARLLYFDDPGGNKDEISGLYQAAQELYPHNARYYYHFALYLEEVGDYAAASEQAEKAIRINSEYDYDPAVRLSRYELYKARGIVNEIRDE